MRTITNYLLPLFILALAFASCQQEGMKTHGSGLRYELLEAGQGDSLPENGEIVEMHFRYGTEDTILYDTRELAGPFRIEMTTPSHEGGSIEDALALMHEGDSLHCLIRAENFFKHTLGQPVPETIAPKSDLHFYIRLQRILTPEALSNLQAQRKEERKTMEMDLLRQYITFQGIEEEPLPSGLYIIPEKKGTGPRPEPGDSVILHYTGWLLDGREFDASRKHQEPLKMKLGAGKVIDGMAEAVSHLREGAVATVLIPSYLAYGPNGAANVIPPYSTLKFKLEILAIHPKKE